MTDPELLLYHFPGACSRVSVCALEMARLDYRVKLVNLAKGEQNEPAYYAISPLGKVPLLIVDGVPLTENAAILTFIAALAPQAGIFPADPAPRMQAEIAGGMSFCGGTLHPQVRGIANPQRITSGDHEPVRERSRALAEKSFAYAKAGWEGAAGGWESARSMTSTLNGPSPSPATRVRRLFLSAAKQTGRAPNGLAWL